MNIGIDIDDTLADTFNLQFNLAQIYTINKLKKSARIRKKNEFPYQLYCKIFHNWADEENKIFWNENYENIITNVKPKYYVKEILEKLRNDGHKIIIITARFPLENVNQEKITKQWLENNNIIYDKLIVNAQDKRKVTKENNIDIFIDDDLENCKNVAKENIQTFLMDSYHNQNIKNDDITRVYSWPHIYQEIKLIQKGVDEK